MKRLFIRKALLFLFITVLLFQTTGCCKKKEQKSPVPRESKNIVETEKPDISVPDESSKLLEKTGLSYSIDRRPPPAPPAYNSFSIFEKQYLDGVQKLEAGELDKAMKVLKSRLLEAERSRQTSETAEQRRLQVGTGDRSERIRTYNYPQSRVTDHRIGLTLYRIDDILSGDLDLVIEPLIAHDRAMKLSESNV